MVVIQCLLVLGKEPEMVMICIIKWSSQCHQDQHYRIKVCSDLRTNERTPRSQNQSRFDWFDHHWVFQRRGRKRCAAFHREHLQIHPSLLRSVRFVGSYSICRRLSTNLGYWLGCFARTNYNHQKGFNYLSASHLRTSRRSDRSCPSHNIHLLGRHNCVVKSLDLTRIYPTVEPLDSTSRILDQTFVGEKHYTVARGVLKLLQDYKSLENITVILSMDELSEDNKLTVARSRKIQKFLSQPFFMSEIFTWRKGKFVELKDTIEGFLALLEGKGDNYPEAAFYMQGTLEEAFEEGKILAMKAGKKWLCIQIVLFYLDKIIKNRLSKWVKLLLNRFFFSLNK
jgi:hypothetical protein